MMAGTKKHDRQALREELDRLGIRISAGMGGGGGRRRSPRRWRRRRRHAGPAHLLRRGQALDAARGHQAARRDPPRAGVPRRRVRHHEAPVARRVRRRPAPSRGAWRPTGSPAPCRPTRRPTSATCRRPRRAQKRLEAVTLDAGDRALPEAARRDRRRTGDRRRLRSRADARADARRFSRTGSPKSP